MARVPLDVTAIDGRGNVLQGVTVSVHPWSIGDAWYSRVSGEFQLNAGVPTALPIFDTHDESVTTSVTSVLTSVDGDANAYWIDPVGQYVVVGRITLPDSSERISIKHSIEGNYLRKFRQGASYFENEIVDYRGETYRAATAAEKTSAGGAGVPDYSNYPGRGATGATSEANTFDWVPEHEFDTLPREHGIADTWTVERGAFSTSRAQATPHYFEPGDLCWVPSLGVYKVLAKSVKLTVLPPVADLAELLALGSALPDQAARIAYHGTCVLQSDVGINRIYDSLDHAWRTYTSASIPGNPNANPATDNISWLTFGGHFSQRVSHNDIITLPPVGMANVVIKTGEFTGTLPTGTIDGVAGTEYENVTLPEAPAIDGVALRASLSGLIPAWLTGEPVKYWRLDGNGDPELFTDPDGVQLIGNGDSFLLVSDDGDWLALDYDNGATIAGSAIVSAIAGESGVNLVTDEQLAQIENLLLPEQRLGAYSVDPADHGKRLAIDTVPTFPSLAVEHVGKWWLGRNESGADMTIPDAANLDLEKNTFAPKDLIFIHYAAVDVYEIAGASAA